MTLRTSDVDGRRRWTPQTPSGPAPGVAIVDPVGQFGEVMVAEATPVFQVEFSNELINAQQILTYSADTGSVFCENGMAVISSGTGVGAFASMQSRKALRYKPGQGSFARFTAMFDTPVEDSIQIAGPFTGGDGFAFGYNGLEFGILHRRAGVRHVHRFTVTTASSTAENVTVTLAGVTYPVAVTASANKATTAQELAAGTFTSGHWQAYAVHPLVGDPYVMFVSRTVGVRSGTFSTTATTVITSALQMKAGAAPTDDWIPQADFNIDNLLAARGVRNPSRLTLVPQMLNVFSVGYQYLGAGGILFCVENRANRKLMPVHLLEYAGTAVVPHIANPNVRMSFAVGSLGSTTDLRISTASIMAGVEGQIVHSGPHMGMRATRTSIGTTLLPVMSIRNPLAFNGRASFAEARGTSISSGVEATKPVEIVVLLNPTLTAPRFDSGYIGDTSSALQRDISATAVTGGRELMAWTLEKTGSLLTEADIGDITLAPGDVLTICARASSGNADVGVAASFEEEL